MQPFVLISVNGCSDMAPVFWCLKCLKEKCLSHHLPTTQEKLTASRELLYKDSRTALNRNVSILHNFTVRTKQTKRRQIHNLLYCGRRFSCIKAVGQNRGDPQNLRARWVKAIHDCWGSHKKSHTKPRALQEFLYSIVALWEAPISPSCSLQEQQQWDPLLSPFPHQCLERKTWNLRQRSPSPSRD